MHKQTLIIAFFVEILKRNFVYMMNRARTTELIYAMFIAIAMSVV